jgi:hypothetical protein
MVGCCGIEDISHTTAATTTIENEMDPLPQYGTATPNYPNNI